MERDLEEFLEERLLEETWRPIRKILRLQVEQIAEDLLKVRGFLFIEKLVKIVPSIKKKCNREE